MIQLDTQGIESEADLQSGKYPKAGVYHAIIEHAEEKMEKTKGGDKPAVAVAFRILAGTVPGQDGTGLTERFWITPNAMVRLKRLATSIGLMGYNQGPTAIDFSKAAGRQLIIEVVEEPYTDNNGNKKTMSNVDYLGMWSLSSPEQANIPRDPAMLALAQQPAAAFPAPVGPMQSPVDQPTAAANPWGGI
jgi:hypothetical protein